MRRWLLFSLIALLIVPTPAAAHPPQRQADRTVTQCGTDDAFGKGLNLRDAVSGGDVIVRFDCGGPATIQITATLEIAGTVRILGGDEITLDGGGAVVMFHMLPGSSLRLNGLNLTGGRYTGPIPFLGRGHEPTPEQRVYNAGVIKNPFGGSILIERCDFFGNVNPIGSVSGEITILRSHFVGNTRTALENHFGLVTVEDTDFRDNTDGLFAGAIDNTGGTVILRGNTQFSGNQTRYTGGAILNSSGTLNIEDSTFWRNHAGLNGGAIALWGQGQVTISRTRFMENTAGLDGGALFQQAGEMPLNSIGIDHSQFSQNSAKRGGAIAIGPDPNGNAGILSLSGVTIVRNSAEEGGALAASNTTLELLGVAIIGNQATATGAALVLHNDLALDSRIANSLIVRNQTISGQASIVTNATAILNTTIAENQGGIAFWAPQPAGPIALSNSILFANAGGNCDNGFYSDGGHNLQFPDLSCGPSIRAAFPWLDTHYAPYGWSPALGAGSLALCSDPPISGKDMLGRPRGIGEVCAIGALERDTEHETRGPVEG